MNITTCFDCKHRRIIETAHEWIECHCKVDGRWHNPYTPHYAKECENWERIGTEDDNGRKTAEI